MTKEAEIVHLKEGFAAKTSIATDILKKAKEAEMLASSYDLLSDLRLGEIISVEVIVTAKRSGGRNTASRAFSTDFRDMDKIIGIVHERMLETLREIEEKITEKKGLL